MHNLLRRGGTWWARLVVPARHRLTLGRREFIQSCGTAELAVAKQISAALLASWREQILRLESRTMPIDYAKLHTNHNLPNVGSTVSLGEVSEATGLGIDLWLRQLAGLPTLNAFCWLSGVKGRTCRIGDLGLELTVATPNGKIKTHDNPATLPKVDDPLAEGAYVDWKSGICRVLNAHSVIQLCLNSASETATISVTVFQAHAWDSEVFVPDEPVTVRASQLEVDRSQVLEHIARLRAQNPLPANADFMRGANVVVLPTLATPPVRRLFTAAVDSYVSEPSGLASDLASESERRQRRKGLLLLSDFMGDRHLDEIDTDMLRAFRDGPLRTIPARLNQLPAELRRDSIPETVEAIKASGGEWPWLTVEMQHERVLWLCRFFSWARRRRWVGEDHAAPLRHESVLTKAERKNLKRDIDPDDEGRGPFTQAELNLIFSVPQYQTGNGAHVKKPSYWYPFQYWLPLLGLFAGLRIKEASQLHLADVRLSVDGVWCFDINETTQDKSLKNAQSKRLVPIHPRLVELGLLDYCAELRLKGYKRVFPELSWSISDAKYAKEPIRKMSAMLLKLGMPRDLMHVFHCLRHNMNNGLLRVDHTLLPFQDHGLNKFIRYAVLGHKTGSDVNSQHYTHTSATEVAALVGAVSYDLPPIAKFDVGFGIQQLVVALGKKLGERAGQEDMGPLN